MLFSYNFWNEFSDLFSQMSAIAFICLGAGIVFCIVEIFQPGFGIFGSVGIALVLVGIGVRIADGGSFAMLFILSMLIMVVILSAFLIMIAFTKRGWIMRNPQLESGGNKPDSAKDYYFLLNLEGTAETDLAPSGKIVINGIIFEVVTTGSHLQKGTRVRVVEVEGAKIVVKPAVKIITI